MQYIMESDDINDYLIDSRYIDLNADIQKAAERIFSGCDDENSKIKAAFEFVRDGIAHSWDIQSERITKTASEALYYREGICYAKTMLLAALLRSTGIPAGLCYQRLTLGDTPDTGYCVHALNAVYIKSIDSWVRIDPRGNTNGIDAQFYMCDPRREQLAFPMRPNYGEIDYPTIYAQPPCIITQALERSANCLEMYQNHLPESL